MRLGINVADLDYTNNNEVLTGDPATAEALRDEITYFSQLLGMKINTAKTKVLGQNLQSDYLLVLYGQELEKFNSFNYLGSLIDSRRGCNLDV